MSEDVPRTLPVDVQPRAREDIAALLEFTERRRGRDQRLAYREILMKGIEAIGRHPRAGRRQNEIGPGCRSIVLGSHVVIYRELEEGVAVLRVLHSRQDIRREMIGDE